LTSSLSQKEKKKKCKMPYNYYTTGEDIANDFSASIKGKTVLVTGASPGGLGASFAHIIASHSPSLIILAGRSIANTQQTASELSSKAPNVQTRILEIDLASQVSVRKAAAEVLAYDEPIDVLVNNAGIMACPYRTTPEGLESQFGSNHIGHFLFTNLIMEKILASKFGGRVVSVSSNGYRLSPIRFEDLGFNVCFFLVLVLLTTSDVTK
jgi:NAD(P)-dependent dehydrogenase (short-subunit alcohol dehydrogenase family)